MGPLAAHRPSVECFIPSEGLQVPLLGRGCGVALRGSASIPSLGSVPTLSFPHASGQCLCEVSFCVVLSRADFCLWWG